MEIWVRSQDKDVLIDSKSFRIKEYFNDGIFSGYAIDCDCGDGCEIEMAHYSTLEKALKVLDMIEKYIYSDGPFSFKQIFQMPQDDEVEV